MRSRIAFIAALCIGAPVVLRGIPWLVQFPNDVGMLLYNQVGLDSQSQQLLFFQPQNIHSFYPLTFSLSRMYFVIAPWPLLVEFISPLIITIVLFVSVFAIWLRNSSESQSVFVVFAFGTMILFYVSLDNFLWFRTCGYWALLSALLLLRLPNAGRQRQTAIFMLLVAAMVLGDDGIVSYLMLFFLVLCGIIDKTRRADLIRKAGYFALFLIFYSGIIGYAGQLYYGNYLAIIQANFISLLSSGVQVTSHISQVGLPIDQLLVSNAAFLIVFAIVPIYLLRSIRATNRLVIFLPSAVLLVLGDAVKVVNSASSGFFYLGTLFGYLLTMLLPLSILSTLFYSKESKTSRVDKMPYPKFSYLIAACVVIILILQANPIVPAGRITQASDPRVTLTLNQASGIYLSQFSTSPPSVEYISDSSTLFIGSQANSQYQVVASLGTAFLVPPHLGVHSVLYSNGVLFLINTHQD